MKSIEASQPNWWQHAVIYQIYPRSFFDTNADGIGDLSGITKKLNYIADLGVDAIWISPFFTSPMKDFGYDVMDYRNVDSMFGDLNDFKQLIAKAHKLQLKVIIDQVYSHSSDQHPWFVQSRQNKDNNYANWYVWADPKPDGSPPNNWLSIFGGSAWTWDTRRRQYYLHNFLSSQPDLNFHHPKVVQAQLDNAKFWLELGVDGFRLDVVNFYFHDQQLRDNPYVSSTSINNLNNPYEYQQHRYDKSRPENIYFLEQFRTLLDKYPGTTSIGEIGDDDPIGRLAEYTEGNNRLHMAYTFELLNEQHDPEFIRQVMTTNHLRNKNGWACWSLSNHDVVRSVTRWGDTHAPTHYAKTALALLFSLQGSVCLYQGEELGLPEANVPYEFLQDPYGITFWPEIKSRDGCRTPIPWDNQQYSGFSSVSPWLPIDPSHQTLTVQAQQQDSLSVLNWTKDFLTWRKQQPAFYDKKIEIDQENNQLISFYRFSATQHLWIVINLTAQIHKIYPKYSIKKLLTAPGTPSQYDGNQLILSPLSAAFIEVVAP